QRDEALVGVDQLHGERVLIEQASGDLVAALRHRFHVPVARTDVGVWIDELLAQLRRRTNGADLGELGRDARTAAVHAMARRALPPRLVHGLAARRVAARDRHRT